MNTIMRRTGFLMLFIGFMACSKKEETTPKVAIQQITLPTETKLATGLSTKLVTTILPNNVSNSYTLQWTSENPAIATVSSDGTVKAVAKGSTNVRVTVYENGTMVNNIAASTRVTVEDFTLSFATTTGNLEIGKTQKLTPVTGPAGFSPTLEWSSANTNVATVATDGTVTARNVGEAMITVTVKEQPSIKATFTVQVGAGKVNPGSGVGDIGNGDNW